MRKYNEGYSMVLVLVVLIVIGLVATFLLSFSLNNLKNQQASVRQMQEEYVAAGEIEKMVAQLMDQKNKLDPSVEEVSLSIPNGDVAWEAKTVTFKAKNEDETVRVTCTLRLVADDMWPDPMIENSYKLENWTDVLVESYEVERISEGVEPQ